MNTVVEAIPGYYSEDVLTLSPFGSANSIMTNKYFWICAILLVTVFISALSVVYVQAENRLLYSHLTSLQKNRDSLHIQWGQLLLEESTWSTQARVEHTAEQQLNMVLPKQKNIVIVKE